MSGPSIMATTSTVTSVRLGAFTAGAWALAIAGGFACSPPARGPRYEAAGATTPREGGMLRLALEGSVSTLDPAHGNDEYTAMAMHAVFDTLVDLSPNGEIVPRLAERWEVSPDGRVYTFELRSGIRFSDGTPITAAHIKYGLERVLSVAHSAFAERLGDIEGAHDVIEHRTATCAGIVAETDRRLTIRLARFRQAFLQLLAMPFAAPQRPEHVAAAGENLRSKPDASGPFELASWDEGTQMVLRRNPYYCDPGRVHLDSIVLLEHVPRDVQFRMLERGELEAAEKVSGPDYVYVLSEPAWQPYVHRGGLNAFGSRMNVREPPFRDRRVRQALNYALDKRHTARLLNATTVPAHGILPPGMFGRDPDLQPYPHDVARARALLAEAGYPDGFEIEYMTPNDEETVKVIGSLQSDLAEVGVRIRISLVSLGAFGTAIASPGGPTFSFIGWGPDFLDPISLVDPNFHSREIGLENSNNNTRYANPELDALLDAAGQELDPARREAMYRRAERILYDDAPWIWDYHRQFVELTQPYVRGYATHPIWTRDYVSAWLDLGADGAPVMRW